nr:MAG TPA: hypothetical protein [Caudoviricetes sp.]
MVNELPPASNKYNNLVILTILSYKVTFVRESSL